MQVGQLPSPELTNASGGHCCCPILNVVATLLASILRLFAISNSKELLTDQLITETKRKKKNFHQKGKKRKKKNQ
jgi:hypothetical protein